MENQTVYNQQGAHVTKKFLESLSGRLIKPNRPTNVINTVIKAQHDVYATNVESRWEEGLRYKFCEWPTELAENELNLTQAAFANF